MLGVNLGLQGHQLREIERTYRGEVNRCKSEVLDFWLRNNENPTWEAITKALDRMQQQKVCHEIRKKYCSSSTATGKYQSRIVYGTYSATGVDCLCLSGSMHSCLYNHHTFAYSVFTAIPKPASQRFMDLCCIAISVNSVAIPSLFATKLS